MIYQVVNILLRFETSMLRSDLCDYSDTYIVGGTIDLLTAAPSENDKVGGNVAFKNNALFRPYISKIKSTVIDNTEDLDIVMPMHN